MKKQFILSLLLCGMSAYWVACSADKLPEPKPAELDCNTTDISYNAHVKGILDANCNVSGCHDNQNFASFGDYNSLGQARRQRLYERIVISKDMPPAGMDQLFRDTVNCWSVQGFLEN